MKIGILSRNYAAKRLIIDKVKNASYENVRFLNYHLWKNAHLWFLRAIGKLNLSQEEQASKLFYKFKMLFDKDYDMLHFFNTINYSYKNPWVISVESGVPWTMDVINCIGKADIDLSLLKSKPEIIDALQYLAAPNCKALLTLSECSRNIQLEILKQFPEFESIITRKLITLQPPQPLIIRSIEEKKVDFSKDQLRFIYIGRDFFRKGGREAIKILSKYKDDFDLKLVIISDLRIDEPKYLLEEEEIEKTRKFIKSNSSWIEYFSMLPNDQVLQLIKNAHIALLPTWMETYGYSVLECQACGCPVISTSLRALKEINDENVGWLINVPVNKLGNPIHNTKDEIQIFKDKLELGLDRCIYHVLTNREEIQAKAEKCIEKISYNNDPEYYSEELQKVYSGNIYNNLQPN